MTTLMKRREFITLLGGAAAAWPRAARAQQRSAMPVIGFLSSASADLYAGRLHSFRQGLDEAGYVEGQNLAVEYRWADGQNDRLRTLAADLIRRGVSVVAATDTPSALALKDLTSTLPIVFYISSDPVEAGLVASLNRPGGNLTGVTNLNLEIGPKRVQLLQELVPATTVIALLVNPTNPVLAEAIGREGQLAARTLGLQLRMLHASAERDFDAVFATLVQLRTGGLVIGTDNFITSRSEQLAALTIRHAVPAVSAYREFPAAGGLMSYGASLTDQYRQVGAYVGRILKGEKPADLPVQQPVKFELVINMKTAKALGLTVPLTLQVAADEVLE